MTLLRIIICCCLFTACHNKNGAEGFTALNAAQEAWLGPQHEVPLSEPDLNQLNWKEVELPRALDRKPELEYLVQTIELPQAPYSHPAILFERIHQSFRIELDGKTLMTYGTLDKSQTAVFQGFSWHVLPLPADFSHKTLRIYSRSNYKYIGVKGLPLLGNAEDLVSMKVRQGWPGIVSASIMAAMFFLIGLARYNGIRSRSLSAIAFYSLISSLFTLAINPMMPVIFPGPYQWAFIEMFTLFSLTPFGMLALASVLDAKSETFLRRYSILSFAFLGFVTLGAVFQLRPAWANYTLFNLMNIISMIVVAAVIIRGVIKGYSESFSISIGLLIVVGGAALESLSSLRVVTLDFAIFPITNLVCVLVLLNLAIKSYFQVQQTMKEQRQAAEAERLNLVMAKERSINSLVGGIAHEFNNPLAIILMCLENLQKALRGSPNFSGTIAKSFAMMEKAIHRVSSLNARLLQLSELQSISGTRVPIKLTQLIQDCCPSTLDLRILPEGFHPAHDAECHIIPDHFKRLMQTLIDNAQEAVQNIPEDQRRPIQVVVTHSHDHITIDCKDWGMGVADEDIPNLFDPFFTTKDVGEGMGINLFFAREYARSMGGDLALINSKQPTQFRITMPTSAP